MSEKFDSQTNLIHMQILIHCEMQHANARGFWIRKLLLMQGISW